MAFLSTGFNVTGKAVMTLTPQGPPPESDINITVTRPSTSQLLEKIGAGTLPVHESRHPLGKKDLTTMMGTMQRQLRLRAGGDGEWNADAQQRLANRLANPKRNGAKTTPLALEDKKPSSSSSTSDSSSSDSDDSSADGSQQQPPASPDVAVELTLTKAKVEETGKEATKQEFEEIFSALRHTSSELEKANTEIAQQKEIIANLSEETPLYHNHHGPIVGLSSGMRFFNSQVPSLFNIKPHAVIR